MANYNLTTQEISSSFQQLMQHDGDTNQVYDGTGSLITNLDVTSSQALTASYAENVVDPTWDNITNKPSGLVSSSVQVSDITGSSLVNASADYSNITFTKGDGTTFEVDSTPRQVIEQVKNSNGFMSKGTPVYVSGSTGNSLNVYAADAGLATRVPATFILDQDLDPGEEGIGILSGFINGVDTSLFAEGANIYLAVGGGYTDVQPTGSAYIQKLGNVVKSAINGSGVISGAGRVNALPNIPQGQAWVGDSNGVPQAVSTASWDAHSDLTQLNQFTQSQEIYNTGINSYTASNDIRVGDIETYVTSSSQRLDLLEDFTGSQQALNTTFATTGSNTFVAQQDINNAGGIAIQTFGDINQVTGDYNNTGGTIVAGAYGKTDGTSTYTGSFNGEFTGSLSVSTLSTGDINVDGTIDVINGGINTSTNTTVSFGRELFVTQSQISSLGAFVLSYPFTSSFGSQGRLQQVYSDYGGGTQFKQELSGVDFSYFSQNGGGSMIFETINNAQIEFFSDSNINFQPNGNLTANKILNQTIDAVPDNNQSNLITINAFTGSNGVIYANNSVGIQNYTGGGIKQAFMYELANASFEKYTSLGAGEGYVNLTIGTGAGYDFDKIEIVDNGDSTSTARIKADNIELGKQTAGLIEIGNSGTNIHINGDTEITASSVSSPALKVWDGGYTDGGQPFPIIQTYSSNDRAASGVAVEVAGGVFFAPGLSSEPLDADTYPLRVTDGTEPRITVLSQNDAAASQTNIELNGNTFIGGVDKNVVIEAQSATTNGNVEIIGNAVTIQSAQPLSLNSGLTINGATLINAGIYQSSTILSSLSNPFTVQLDNQRDYFILEVDNAQQVILNVNDLVGSPGRNVRLVIAQGAVTGSTVELFQGTGNPYPIFGPAGSFSGNQLTLTQSPGAHDYFEFVNMQDTLFITSHLPNLSGGTF